MTIAVPAPDYEREASDLLRMALTGADPSLVADATDHVLIRSPGDPIALFVKGTSLLRLGRDADALDPLFASVQSDAWTGERLEQVFRLWTGNDYAERTAALLEQRGEATPRAAELWTFLGQLQRHVNQPKAALAPLRRAAESEPGNLDRWTTLAYAAAGARDTEELLRALEPIPDLDPEHKAQPDVRFLQAIALGWQGRLDEAIRMMRNADTAAFPSIAERALILLIESLGEHGRLADAIVLLDDAARAVPPSIDLLRTRGRVMMLTGRAEEGTRAFDEAFALAPSDASKALVRFEQAQALEATGDLPAALGQLEAALALPVDDGDRAVLELWRARFLAGLNQYPEALALASGIDESRLQPSQRAQRSLIVGVSLVGENRLLEAREHLELARAGLVSTDQGVALFFLAKVANEARDFETALSLRAQAREAGIPDSTHAFALFDDAISLAGLQKFEEALAKADAALGLVRADAVPSDWLVIKGNLLAVLGKPREAIEVWTAAVDRATPGRERGLIRLKQASTAESAGWIPEAYELATTALAELPPDDETIKPRVGTLGIGARALKALARPEDALVLVEEAATLIPVDEMPPAFVSFRWELLIELGRLPDALAVVEDMLAHSRPRHPYHLMLRMETLRRSGRDPAEIYAAAAEATDNPPELAQDPFARVAVALALAMLQRWDEAIAAYEEMLALEPGAFDPPGLRLNYAMTLTGAGRHERALELLESMPALSPALDVQRWVAIGQARAGLGDHIGAYSAFEQAREMARHEPGVDRVTLATAEFGMGMALFHQERFREAVDALQAAVDHLGETSGFANVIRTPALSVKAFALHKLGRTTEALATVDHATRFARGAAPPGISAGLVWWFQGKLLEELDREEEAIRAYDRAEREGMLGNSALVAKGGSLLSLEDYERARKTFEAAVARAIDDEERFAAISGKGRALFRLHRHEEAIDAFRTALDLDCDSARTDWVIWQRLGDTCHALDRLHAALRAYRRGWSAHPGPERPASLALGISATLLSLDRPREAVEFLAKARLPEGDASVAYNHGVALMRVGRVDEARRKIAAAARGGLSAAEELLPRLDRKAGAGTWVDAWFGRSTGWARRALGALLLAGASLALFVPFLHVRLYGELDWKLLLVAPMFALVLLVLPSLRNLSFGVGDLKIQAEPSGPSGTEPQPGLTLPTEPLIPSSPAVRQLPAQHKEEYSVTAETVVPLSLTVRSVSVRTK